MGQFQFRDTEKDRRWVNWKLAIRENKNLIGQITIGVFAQISVGDDNGRSHPMAFTTEEKAGRHLGLSPRVSR